MVESSPDERQDEGFARRWGCLARAGESGAAWTREGSETRRASASVRASPDEKRPIGRVCKGTKRGRVETGVRLGVCFRLICCCWGEARRSFGVVIASRASGRVQEVR